MSRGRARNRGRGIDRAIERAIEKALTPGGAAMFGKANRGSTPRGRDVVGLAQAIAMSTGQQLQPNGMFATAVPYPRSPLDNVPFGPSGALPPQPLDPIDPKTGQALPRLTEYPVSWNLPGNGQRLVPFETLRAAADNVDIMRRCIEIRKSKLAGMKWTIGLSDETMSRALDDDGGARAREDVEAELRRKFMPEIDRMTRLWRKPWATNGVNFNQWLRGVIEDHSVLDAVVINPQRSYGGQVLGFELIDGATVKPLIDSRGSRPLPPHPAFQQGLYGYPRGEYLATVTLDEQGNEVLEGVYTAGELFYHRENYRSFTPYGFPAVEQALIAARLYLKRQGWMLAEYDDGSTPLMWLVPEATPTVVDAMTPANRREWERTLNDALTGNTAARHRIKLTPPGFTPTPMPSVDERYKPDYDMHLIKGLAGFFGVTSTELGYSESKGLGNSGLHEGQADVADRTAQRPDEEMIAELINELSRRFCGMPEELVFRFVNPEDDSPEDDAAANSQRERGTLTLNDDRRKMGKAPFTFKEADMALVKVGDGWVPLEGMAERAEKAAEAEQALVDDQLATSEQNRELADQSAAMEAEELSGESAEKALELSAYRRWARKPSRSRAFICKHLEPTDWPGGDVPADVDFEAWEWVPEHITDDMILKGFGQGNDNWRTLARDHRGRWVKRGTMRVTPYGPDSADGAVMSGLRAAAESRRAASTAPSAVDVTRGSSAADKLRRAETMYGTDRSKWPARARQDAEKLERQLHANNSSTTMAGMTKPDPRVQRERAAALNAGIASLAEGGAPSPMAARIMARQETSVTDTINGLADVPGAWVALSDVRRKLEREHGMDRAQQDIVIRRMALNPNSRVNLVPEDNQKTLADAEYAGGAIDLGAGPQHLIQIEPERNTPAQPATEAEATERADAAAKDYQDAQDRAYLADDAAHSADREDAALNAAAVQAQAEADRLRTVADAAENDLNDRFIAPRMNAEREAKNRRMHDAITAANEARENDARAKAAREEREARQREAERVMAEQQRIERRNEMIRRTPEGYAAMLGGRANLTHAPSRKLVEAMRAQDFKLVGMVGGTSDWEAPDGRTMKLVNKGGSVAPFTGGNDHTMKAAHEYVGVGKPATPAPDPKPVSPDAPSAAEHPQKAAYDRLLDGGMVKHKPSRQIIEQMEAHGWTLASQDSRYEVFQFEAPDGRKMTVQHLTREKPKFYPGGGVKGGNPSYKAALAHVVTPAHEEVGGPSVTRAANQVSPGLGDRASDSITGGGGNDQMARTLGTAQRQLAGYSNTPKRSHAEVSADLRSQADRMDALAQSNAEHHERMGDLGESKIAERQRAEAQQFRAIADVLDQQATERAEYEAEVARRAAAPLDIRPTTRGKAAAPVKPAAKPAEQSINDAMAARMLASTTNPSTFGGEHGTVTHEQVTRGTRIMFRNQHAVEALESPRPAAADSQGRAGKVFRVRRENDGVEGTMRLNDGERVALAAPKTPAPGTAATRPALEDRARAAGVSTRGSDRQVRERIAAARPATPAPAAPRLTADAETYDRIADRVRLASGDAVAARVLTGMKPSAVAEVGARFGVDTKGMTPTQARAAILARRSGGERPKSDASAPATPAATLAAAPKGVEGTGTRGIDRPGTAALERYRGKEFGEINRELRAGAPSAANQRTAEQIDRVMGESKLSTDVTVYRGIGDIERVFGAAAGKKLTGAEWTDNSFQSTTASADTADTFLIGEGGRRTAARLHIRVPAGTGAVQLSDERYEAELLLQRGLKMRVVSDTGPWRRGQKGVRTIEVEVIPA